jgi:DNA-binding MarR family transcriptional regulator
VTVAPRFDDEIHAQVRLRICAALAPVRWVDFPALRDALGVADSVLSKHLSRLEDAGYVEVVKGLVTDGRRSTVRLTAAGRTALAGHLAALRQIADDAEGGPAAP